jgi:hypothetical protein
MQCACGGDAQGARQSPSSKNHAGSGDNFQRLQICFNEVIHSAPLGIAVLGSNGQITQSNAAFARFFKLEWPTTTIP